MNRKTIMSTLILVLGIGGVMLYLQTNEADNIEKSVLRVEAEKAIQFTQRDFEIAAYVLYYKDVAFYSKEEAVLYSKLDMIGRQTVGRYMHGKKEYLQESELQMYKKQAQDEVMYEFEKGTHATFYESLQQQLQVTKDDYITHVYKMRLSDVLYERLSREQNTYVEAEQDPFFQFWRSELAQYDLSEQKIDEALAQIDQQSEPASPQPNWLANTSDAPLLMQHKKTKQLHMRTHAIYDIYAYERYSPMMYHIERTLSVPITRSTIHAAIDALTTYEYSEEEAQAYEDMQHILSIYARDTKPFYP